MSIVLIGEPDSKRTKFFLNAAEFYNEEIQLVTYEKISDFDFKNKFIKIDPVSFPEQDIFLNLESVNKYFLKLLDLESIKNVKFLNTPSALIKVLDKKACKDKLKGLDVTPEIEIKDLSYFGLKKQMEKDKIQNIFIKPNLGSGAAGVLAYRFRPFDGKERLYTSLIISDKKLLNTKKLRKFEDREIIKKYIDKIIKSSIIEKWIPKASFKGLSYDLRIVVQFGKVDFIVGRLSNGPITNLHLNNNAVNINELGIPEEKLEKAKNLALESVKRFEGLNVAGVDILLRKNDYEPFIIEINGQGDLIYQDKDNFIYKNQIKEILHGEK